MRKSSRAATLLVGASLVLSTVALGEDRAPGRDALGTPEPGVVAAAGEGFLPELPHLRLFETEEQDALVTEALIVDAVYTAFERAIQQSGYEIEIETSDAFTYYADDFERAYWPDVVTQASPLRLEVSTSEVDWNDDPVGVAYKPSWLVLDSPEDKINLEGWRANVAATTLAEVAANGRKDGIDGDKELVALTSFAVWVAFDGRETDYRAAMFWLAEADGRVRFRIEDRVTDYIGGTITSSALVAPVDQLLEIGAARAIAKDKRQEIQ